MKHGNIMRQEEIAEACKLLPFSRSTNGISR